jgi:hypothetical protein
MPDCPKCSVAFNKKRSNQRFCSRSCRIAFNVGDPLSEVKGECEFCKGKFTKVRKIHRFCCKSHKVLFHRGKNTNTK